MRTLLALAAGLTLGAGTPAPTDHGKPKVKVVSAQDIVEKLDGKAARVTTVEVTLGPGRASAPHRHPGPVFGYVLAGEYEWAIDDRPVRRLRAGDTFYEPAGCLHRVSRNPGKVTARILAVMPHPRDAKHLVIPDPAKH